MCWNLLSFIDSFILLVINSLAFKSFNMFTTWNLTANLPVCPLVTGRLCTLCLSTLKRSGRMNSACCCTKTMCLKILKHSIKATQQPFLQFLTWYYFVFLSYYILNLSFATHRCHLTMWSTFGQLLTMTREPSSPHLKTFVLSVEK